MSKTLGSLFGSDCNGDKTVQQNMDCVYALVTLNGGDKVSIELLESAGNRSVKEDKSAVVCF